MDSTDHGAGRPQSARAPQDAMGFVLRLPTGVAVAAFRRRGPGMAPAVYLAAVGADGRGDRGGRQAAAGDPPADGRRRADAALHGRAEVGAKELMVRADRALYRTKEGGRDGLRVF